jgi:hypothetical protein
MTNSTTISETGPHDQDNEERPIAMEGVESQRQSDGVGPSKESSRGRQDEGSFGKAGSEKEESSSSDGKGASGGSGGGYQADDDCSSSESSVGKNGDGSLGDAPKKDGLTRDRKLAAVKTISGNTSFQDNEDGPVHRSAAINYASDASRSSHSASDPTKQGRRHHEPKQHQRIDKSLTQSGQETLPQWNGVRIQHPMDPRIDLSTVGYLSALNLQDSKHNQSVSYASLSPLVKQTSTAGTACTGHFNSQNALSSVNNSKSDGQPPPLFPSFEQYMKLMEVTRTRRWPRNKTVLYITHNLIIIPRLVGPSFLSCAWYF